MFRLQYDYWRENSAMVEKYNLTETEKQIIKLKEDGALTEEIAEKLQISAHTVNSYLVKLRNQKIIK